MNYLVHIVIMVALYGTLGVSLNILSGFTGLTSLAHAALYGIGAYAVAIACTTIGLSFWYGAALGVIITVGLAFVLGKISLRVHGDYFVLATFAFQVVVHGVLHNWVEVTRGAMGIPRIPRPVLLGITLESRLSILAMGIVLLVFAIVLSRLIARSSYGRVLAGIREDEVLVTAYGRNVAMFKIQVFALSAMLASLAGSVYATYITFVDPSSFSLFESVFILSIVVVGGNGSIAGSVLGAALLISVSEGLRFVGIPTSIAGNMRQILYGMALILMMRYRPHGLVGLSREKPAMS